MNSDNHTIIIAEIGVNHQGSLDLAKRLIDEAANAGVDYVKFQTFKAENLVCASAERADYQKANCGGEESQLDMLRRYELSAQDFSMLAGYCREQNVGFLSSAFDLESVDLLSSIGMDYWKIPSGEITNLPYLRAIGRVASKIILSTGMSTLDEVEAAVVVLEKEGINRSDIILLHCTTQYPTPVADVNLLAMDTLKTLGCAAVGYSDHTEGVVVPIAAVARGAKVVEKHFTIDKSLSGPDHKASLTPDELRDMVMAIRKVESALGSSDKMVGLVEFPNRGVARKSIVARKYIKAGELFTTDNLTVKRPGSGVSPMCWDEVLGQPAKRDFSPDSLIEI